MSMNTLRQYVSIANFSNKIYLKKGQKLRKTKQFYWNIIEQLNFYVENEIVLARDEISLIRSKHLPIPNMSMNTL